MPDAQQHIAALRKALDKTVGCGAFHKSRSTVQVAETEDWPAVRVEVRANKFVGPKLADYIAACNPEAMRAILAHIDALEAEKIARKEPGHA